MKYTLLSIAVKAEYERARIFGIARIQAGSVMIFIWTSWILS